MWPDLEPDPDPDPLTRPESETITKNNNNKKTVAMPQARTLAAATEVAGLKGALAALRARLPCADAPPPLVTPAAAAGLRRSTQARRPLPPAFPAPVVRPAQL